MNQSPNKQQMADAAKKLEQARQEAQKAAENLQNESVSKLWLRALERPRI